MQLETLGDAWTYSVRVHMWCNEGHGDGMKRKRPCVYNRELDLPTLVCTRGRAFPIARLAERLRCPECGSRRIRVLFRLPEHGATMRAESC